MSIKKGIKNGDLVYISAVSTSDLLHKYGGKRASGAYNSEAEYKHSSLVGMIGKLVAHREPEGKHNKSGVTRAIIRLTLPENFFHSTEENKPTYWNRHFNVEKIAKKKQFDVLFSTGVKLDIVSLMPCDLRYGYANTEIVKDYVREADLSKEVHSCAEHDFTPEVFSGK